MCIDTNRRLIEIIKRTKIDNSYLYKNNTLNTEKIEFLSQKCLKVLDIGKSSRELFTRFTDGQVVTLDINQYDGYPDIIDDICNPTKINSNSFDGVVCNAILEHVYDPFGAVRTIHSALKKGGYCLAYAPFLFRYHAAGDFRFQDYYRFTKDGLAFLFQDFENVTLYPVRGKYSTILNLTDNWKSNVEKRFGSGINKIIDRFFGNRDENHSVSGYSIWAQK